VDATRAMEAPCSVVETIVSSQTTSETGQSEELST